MSAFAPAHTANRGEAQQNHGHLTPEEAGFVSRLHEASLCGELDGLELTRSARLIEHNSAPARRLDLLDAYYEADGDPSRDSNGALLLRAEAFGIRGGWRAVEATLAATPVRDETGAAIASAVAVIAWREAR